MFFFMDSAFGSPQILWLLPEDWKGQAHKIEAMDGETIPENLPTPKKYPIPDRLSRDRVMHRHPEPEPMKLPEDTTLEEMERWVDSELIRLARLKAAK